MMTVMEPDCAMVFFVLSVMKSPSACGIDVYRVRTTIVGCRNAFLRDVNADGCNGFVIAAPTTTPKGYGEREQICIKHKSFHKVLFCFFKDDVANGDVCSNGCTTEVKEE